MYKLMLQSWLQGVFRERFLHLALPAQHTLEA